VTEDHDEAVAKMIEQAFAAAMPEIRQNVARMRATIAEFFGVAVEHLPAENTVGWLRLVYTYLHGRRLKTHPSAADELSVVLSGDLYADAKEPSA
jgi:hypothetical protein